MGWKKVSMYRHVGRELVERRNLYALRRDASYVEIFGFGIVTKLVYVLVL
jgi:hypothetical protein